MRARRRPSRRTSREREHQSFGEGLLDESIAYWKKRLAGARRAELPARRQPPSDSGQGSRLRRRVDAGTTSAIEALARDERASMLMVLLAAWAGLLHRYGAGTDLVVGVTVAGRRDPEARDVIGHLSNTIAVRCDLQGDPTIRELVRRVRSDALMDAPHHVAPFDAVVDALQPADPTAASAIFQHLLVVVDAPTTSFTLPGIAVEAVPVDTGVARCELTLEVVPRAGVLYVTLEYATDFYDDAIASQILDDVATVLRAVASQPDVALSQVALSDDTRGEQ